MENLKVQIQTKLKDLVNNSDLNSEEILSLINSTLDMLITVVHAADLEASLPVKENEADHVADYLRRLEAVRYSIKERLYLEGLKEDGKLSESNAEDKAFFAYKDSGESEELLEQHVKDICFHPSTSLYKKVKEYCYFNIIRMEYLKSVDSSSHQLVRGKILFRSRRFTQEELGSMSQEEFAKNEKEIANQLKKGLIL